MTGLAPIVVEIKGGINDTESKMRELESRDNTEYITVKENF